MYNFHNSILRAYDIRGIFGETLNDKDAYFVGKSFAKFLHNENKKKIVIGFDGRLSSPVLRDSLIKGLIESGAEILNIGLCPTPMLYFSVYHLKADAGIMITGSHNPGHHNGFKFLLKDRPFFGEDIQTLGKIAAKGEFAKGNGEIKDQDVIDNYVNRLAQDCVLNFKNKDLKISWDIGNGATGHVIKKLITKLKAQHFLLFEEIDGNFPNHHPDPTVEENLEDLKKSITQNGCNIGIAFDGDGDRVGVVDNKGNVIWGDQLMCLFAKDVLESNQGATIIADVKASQVLFDEIKKHGGNPLMWKTGHSWIKSKMKETGALLAGEMSGHIFFADSYYGFDDGIYAAIRMLNILVKSGRTLSQIREDLPKTFSTPEIKIASDEENKFKIVENVKKKLKENNVNFNDVDGVRVKNEKGWWLLRASNTSAYLIARCEAKNQKDLEELKKELDFYLNESKIY